MPTQKNSPNDHHTPETYAASEHHLGDLINEFLRGGIVRQEPVAPDGTWFPNPFHKTLNHYILLGRDVKLYVRIYQLENGSYVGIGISPKHGFRVPLRIYEVTPGRNMRWEARESGIYFLKKMCGF